jgi:pectinesterase
MLTAAVLIAAGFMPFPGNSSADGVDTLLVAADGTGAYRTVQEAVTAAGPSGATIIIRPGRYHEKVEIPESTRDLVLMGEDPQKVVITFDDYSGRPRGEDTIRTATSWTMRVGADGVILEGLTFENAAGPVGQAVAVMVDGDRIVFRRCRFLGHQDTFYLRGSGRVYVSECYVAGTTDFIFGSSIALFDDCVIHSRKKSYITAASTPEGRRYGLVFRRCRLTAEAGIDSVYLGRPWRPFARTVFLSCDFGAHIHPAGWHNWRKPEAERTVFYAEYQCTGAGADEAARVPWSHVLDDRSAEGYTTTAIFAANPGGPGFAEKWDPHHVGKMKQAEGEASGNHSWRILE